MQLLEVSGAVQPL